VADSCIVSCDAGYHCQQGLDDDNKPIYNCVKDSGCG
jgi:hypothetical protein